MIREWVGSKRFNDGERRVECQVRGRTVTIFDVKTSTGLGGRPAGDEIRIPVAQLRYRHGAWWLFWADGKHRWHSYEYVAAAATPEAALAELERDPDGAFWD
jgi:hypothetical protein